MGLDTSLSLLFPQACTAPQQPVTSVVLQTNDITEAIKVHAPGPKLISSSPFEESLAQLPHALMETCTSQEPGWTIAQDRTLTW